MTLTELDISGLNYPELSELKAKIETRIQDMREAGVPALSERFVEEAAALGVTLEEVVASGKMKRGRPRKPRQDGEEIEAVL
jgi:TATA-binding protein-associated factor Taf7